MRTARRLRAGSAAWLLLAASAAVAAPPVEVQIAGLSDLSLGSWWGLGPLEGTTLHCVLSTGSGAYSVEARGDGPGGSFALLGPADSIGYETWYNDGSGWIQLGAAVPLSGRQGLSNQGQFNRCLDGKLPGAEVRVRIPETALEASLAGSYAGQLELLVAPE